MLEGLSKPSDIAEAAESFYKKLVIADKYQTNSVFNGSVTFIKAKDNFVQLGDDYGLSEVSINFKKNQKHGCNKLFLNIFPFLNFQVCKSKVQSYTVKGNHRDILVNDNVINVANIVSQNVIH